MGEKDILRITVGNNMIGIVGLTGAMDEIAAGYASRSDEDVRAALTARLRKTNYIPGHMEEAYGKAFVREFRKYLGQPFEKEPDGAFLEVKILGQGCARCDGLRQAVIDAASRLNLPVDVEHVTDSRECQRYGVFGFPALVVNGTVRSVDAIPSTKAIERWLSDDPVSLKET